MIDFGTGNGRELIDLVQSSVIGANEAVPGPFGPRRRPRTTLFSGVGG